MPSTCLPPSSQTLDAGAKPASSRFLDMNDRSAGGRRRRSSSILQVYHEPLETLEQMSDQAVVPNVNANWTNQKGMSALISAPYPTLPYPTLQCLMAGSNVPCGFDRGLDYPHRHHRYSQDPLRRYPGQLSGSLVDADQHDVHGWLLHHVSLRPRHSLRLQWRCL